MEHVLDADDEMPLETVVLTTRHVVVFVICILGGDVDTTVDANGSETLTGEIRSDVDDVEIFTDADGVDGDDGNNADGEHLR